MMMTIIIIVMNDNDYSIDQAVEGSEQWIGRGGGGG